MLCSYDIISGIDLSPLDPMCSSIVLPDCPSTGKQFTIAFHPTCQGLSKHVQYKGNQSGTLQEIPQLIIVYEILLQPTSRRFLRELDEAPGGNNLHYILQHPHVPVSVTRV